jgi:hypothetical protein
VYDPEQQKTAEGTSENNAQQHSTVDSQQQTAPAVATPIGVHTPVELLFQRGVHAALYSAYDSSGIPTHNAQGQPLSKVDTQSFCRIRLTAVYAHMHVHRSVS